MPDAWRQELKAAVKCLDGTKIVELLEQVPADKSVLTEKIETLTQDFRYDLILELLDMDS